MGQSGGLMDCKLLPLALVLLAASVSSTEVQRLEPLQEVPAVWLQDSSCGNGNRESGEACDDGVVDDYGAKKGGAGCAADCTVETGFECEKNSDDKDVCTPKCGDGKKLGNEECDDGNTTDGDGCSSSCEVEDGKAC